MRSAPVAVYVSSYYYICLHTTEYVSLYYSVCPHYYDMLPHTTICVLMLLCVCPHTTMCVSSYYCTAIYMSSYYEEAGAACAHRRVGRMASQRCHICVLVLLCMCPHTAMYVSLYCYIRVLLRLCMCPHNAMYMSSNCYVCVLILRGTAQHTYTHTHTHTHTHTARLLAVLFETERMQTGRTRYTRAQAAFSAWARIKSRRSAVLDIRCALQAGASSYYYIRVLILLHMCPHTATYVSSYYSICVLPLSYICVLILLYMCGCARCAKCPLGRQGKADTSHHLLLHAS
jgi:hypothetical protein